MKRNEFTKASQNNSKAEFSNASVTRSAFSVVDFARNLGISRSSVYKLLSAGRIRSFKIGARRLIPAIELKHLLSADPDSGESSTSSSQ
jgi:excisionase family DNA binding protein